MIQISIPGYDTLVLEYLVLDYNGTIAQDGLLIPGVAERLKDLSRSLRIFTVTADTHGSVARNMKGLPVAIEILGEDDQRLAKQSLVERLGANACVSMGNGRNDAMMLKHSAPGIGILQKEGACSETLINSHIIVTDILDALDLLIHKNRLIATLRNL